MCASHFVLDGPILQYFKDGGEHHTIQLNKVRKRTITDFFLLSSSSSSYSPPRQGCKVRVVDAGTPARKDRFEDNDTSMGRCAAGRSTRAHAVE